MMDTNTHQADAAVDSLPTSPDRNVKDVKILQDGGKTYVIIVKDDKHVPHPVGAGKLTGCIKQEAEHVDVGVSQKTRGRLQLGQVSKDRVKRNLVNIGDESEDEDLYTPSSELAEVFGVANGKGEVTADRRSGKDLLHKESKWLKTKPKPKTPAPELSSQVGPEKSRLTRDVTFNSPSDVTETNLALNRKLFASPTSVSTVSPAIYLSNKTPLNTGPEDNGKITPDCIRHAYKTPTPELPVGKLGAVRKIFVIQESPKSSSGTPKQTRKAVNSPQVTSTPGGPKCSTPVIIRSPYLVTSGGLGSGSPATLLQVTQTPTRSPAGGRTGAGPKVKADKQGGKCTNLDDSLTNIQWLGGLASEGLVPKTKAGAVPSGKEIERMSLECGRHKRPSYSYMMLIRMALNSREDKKMTLREICKWIEDTFPFYKHTAKPGWRNSIRHNLSVYDIFVRVPSNPKQHGSHWTVKESNSKKTKYSKSSQNKDTSGRRGFAASSLTTHVLSSLPILSTPMGMTQLNMPSLPCSQTGGTAQQGTNKKAKKGPTPILPRPPVALSMPPGGALQAYALIPITSLGSTLPPPPSQLAMGPGPGQPVPISVDHTAVHSQTSTSEGSDQLRKSTPSTPVSVVPCDGGVMLEDRGACTSNVIKEAWQTAGCWDSDSTPHSQESTNDEQPAKRTKVKPGLPKPKMYTKSKSGSKSKKTAKKCKTVQRNSTPVKQDKIISEDQLDNDIENGLPTPLRQLLDTPAAEPGTTTTPLKSLTDSPKWLSPIAGLTPGKHGGLPDGSFLDFLPTNFDCDSPTIVTPVKSLEAWLKIATGLMDTPNASLLQVNPTDLSPLRGAGDSEGQTKDNPQSISHLLAEIDPCLVDELDNSQFNLSNLNWANPFQSS